MSRARADTLHTKLRKGIGSGPIISAEEYEWLMENQNLISARRRASYVTTIVDFLRENHSLEITEGELNSKGNMMKEGNRIENILGIPENNYSGGDLYGVELKCLKVESKTPLRLTTTTLGTDIKVLAQNLDQIHHTKISNIVYYKKVHGELKSGNRYILKNGERIFVDSPNSLNRFKLTLDDNNVMSTFVKYKKSGPWEKTSSCIDLKEKMSKFRRGLILVFYTGREYNRSQKTYAKINLLHTEIMLDVNTDWIMEKIRSKEIGVEVRYGGGKKFDDSGPAWEISRSEVNELIYLKSRHRTRQRDWKCKANLFQ